MSFLPVDFLLLSHIKADPQFWIVNVGLIAVSDLLPTAVPCVATKKRNGVNGTAASL